MSKVNQSADDVEKELKAKEMKEKKREETQKKRRI